MTWLAECIADSAWAAYLTDEASGSLADSSGNGRTMTFPSGSPTYQEVGPDGTTLDGLLFAAGTSNARTSATVGATTTAAAVECCFKFDVTPSSPTALCGFTYFGNSTRPLELYVDSTGKLHLWWGDPQTIIVSAAAPSLGEWHHAVGTVGGGSGKIRLDKADVASGAGTLSLASSAKFAVHGGENKTGAADLTNGSQMYVSRVAAYRATLSDARIDAHYDAVGITPAGPATISGVWGLIG